MRSKLTVLLTAIGTNSLLLTSSSAATAHVDVTLTAVGTDTVCEVMLIAYKHRDNNVLYTNFNKLCPVFNVEFVTSFAVIELNITGSGICRSYC